MIKAGTLKRRGYSGLLEQIRYNNEGLQSEGREQQKKTVRAEIREEKSQHCYL